ncbi:MAG: ABC transporter ATP-binding protein/permease [Bacilli bacterium]|nr:ABC transporter ATP-binding protein/permease [Bacilli bacterium]
MLQLRNITKTYKVGNGQVVALDNVSIDFPDKGIVFVVGKSGSGKSTLLNILGGLDKMDSGEIIIDGKSTSDFSGSDFDAYRNYHIGFIFQEFNLLDDLSVRENIALALKMQAKGHDATTIDEALKLVNLEGLGYRTPKELSGGQKQRIAVARALVKNPNIILADEPTGALDSKTGYDLMSSLKSLSKDKLVIVVTHDAEMANIFGDEIIQLTDGHIIDHLVISPSYIKPANEMINDKIIKISSGNKIESAKIINNALAKNSENYICLTSQPEQITIAYPETYEKIFAKEDLSKKFISCKNELKEIERSKDKKTDQKAKISLKECFKMAMHQFSKSKGRFLFLIIFTVISFSLLGFSYLLSTVNDSSIIANTLSNNDIKLAMMEKSNELGKEIFTTESLDDLKEEFKNTNFAIGKEVDLKYTSGTLLTNSAFEMGRFKGIVECEDVTDLNLKIIEGKASFDENSLVNHEIIISDYAAFELRRTGYLGCEVDGSYGVVKPETLQEQINTQVLINTTLYKIVGVFDTNYEDFLPLLVSEIYVTDGQEQASSLHALKSYYYARVFGPTGFYQKYIDESGFDVEQTFFEISASNLMHYEYDSTNNALVEEHTLVNLSTNNISRFYPIETVTNYYGLPYETKWGQMPTTLTGNQIVLCYDWIKGAGYTNPLQIEQAIEEFESKTIIKKMADSTGGETVVYNDGFEVVAVIDIHDRAMIDRYHYFYDVPMFFSNEYIDIFNNAIYSYDQIVFTLEGSKMSYANTIKDLNNYGFSVLNIDGSASYQASDLYSFRSIALIASAFMFLFCILIMFNYTSTNIKLRRKEIGILRATGARGRDIVKIFAIEEGLIAAIISIISLIIIGVASSMVNEALGNVDIGIQLIVFNFFRILLIVIVIMAFFILTNLIPVAKIAKMKPIEAIRKI